jgi:hypothetical protein
MQAHCAAQTDRGMIGVCATIRRRPIDHDGCQFSKPLLVKPVEQEGRKRAVQALPTIGFAKQALLLRAEYD